MKAKRLLTSLALVASTCAALHAQYDPSLRPTADAQWDFENAANFTENSIEGSALSIECGIAGTNTFTLGANKITSIGGPSDTDKAIALQPGDIFKMNLNTTETVSNYTLLWNVRISSAAKFHALLQTAPDNTTDGDVFINRNTPSVGLHLPTIGFGYAGNATFNEWHTIVLSVKDGIPTTYMDGSLLVAATGADERFTLKEGYGLLFCDNDGEYDAIDVSQVAYWNKALTLDEVFPAAQAEIPELVDGYYQLENAEDFKWFADRVNSGDKAINAVLTADINMEGVEFAPIGTETHHYGGKFDGQYHVISNLKVNLPQQSYVGVFGVVAGGAEIKHFTVDSSCSFVGLRLMGVVGGSNSGGEIIIDGIGSEANFTGEQENISGIYGVNMGSQSTPKISNCYVTGKIVGGRESGAITGWAANGAITNCYSIADVTGADNAGASFFRGNPSVTNCYCDHGANNTTAITEEDLTSGKLTFMLNGNQEDIHFVQTIGTDAYPVLLAGSKTVYASSADCGGNILEGSTYTNTPTVLPEHTHVDGICSVCGHLDTEAFQPVDGVYEIGTPGELYWFARMVCAYGGVKNARLTADIDYSEYNQMIGGRGNDRGYEGEFDGQGYTVTVNFEKTNGSEDCSLFASLYNATIKNLCVKGNITSNGKYAAGLASHTYGNCTIENVVTDVNIVSGLSGDATNAGILAVAENPTVIKNCLVAGSQSATNGASNCGGVIGWASGASTLTNILIIADITVGENDSYTVSRNIGNVTANNVYYTKPFANTSKGIQATEEQVTSGALANLFGWGQTIGTDATPSPLSAAKVYKYGATLTNTYMPALEMPILSTPENPVFYYIKNVRSNKYVQYTGVKMNQVAEQGAYENMFYFVADGEPVNGFVPVTIRNAMGGGKAMTNFDMWGVATRWYAYSDPTMSDKGMYFGTTTDVTANCWWNDHGQSTVGSWVAKGDGGSIWQVEKVADEDVPVTALVAYNHIANGETLYQESGAVIVGSAYPAPAVPVYVNATAPEGIVEGDVTVDINVEIVTPFEASTDYANAKWYQIVNEPERTPRQLYYNGTLVCPGENSYADEYLWSFYGNPYVGYKVMNRATGEGQYLSIENAANGVKPTFTENATVWEIGMRDDNTFGFGVNGFWINRNGGTNGVDMALWHSGPAADLGSTLVIAPVEFDIETERYTAYDATPTAIASKNGVTMLSTATEFVIATYAGSAQIVDETAQVTVYDYFADKTFNITPVVDGNKVKITLPEAYASSALLYVTIPAGMIQMENSIVLEGETKFTYYVHGSDILTEEAINKILSIIGGGETAIEGVVSGQTTVDVYSINGAAVKKGANAADLKALKGIYIVNGKKVILK